MLGCDILIGTRYGEARALIPASLGGPAVLAFPPSCDGAKQAQAWPMFVEAIQVVSAVVPAGKPAGKGDGG